MDVKQEKDTEDGRRDTYLELWEKKRDMSRQNDGDNCLERLCSSLRHQMALMLTSVQWELICVILVLIEVLINVVLMLMEFHVIKESDQHAASHLLHFVGITILAVFVFEIFVKLYSMGPEYFWKEKIEIFDAFIVITAFTVEIILSFYHPKKAWKSLAFIIALRLWRIFRVISNIIMFKGEVYELVGDVGDDADSEETEEKEPLTAGIGLSEQTTEE